MRIRDLCVPVRRALAREADRRRMGVFELLAQYDDIIRCDRENAIIKRWDESGGYLIGACSSDPREPRVWHDEHGDSLDASQREEGDANGGLVGASAHDAVREANQRGMR